MIHYLQIILMSATIDADKFARYFATPVMGHLVPAKKISVGGSSPFSTSIHYLEQILPLFGKNLVAPKSDDPFLTPDMVDIAVNIIKKFDTLEDRETYKSIPSDIDEVDRKKGAVLMFVPGLMEIEMVISKLRVYSTELKWILHPLHSSITMEEQKEAFKPSSRGYRKIIVSTNIAESSITVPDVVYVVDFCLTKIMQCDPDTSYTCLKLAWASKASCDQRAGRVGRTSQGRVYRMIERYNYENLASYCTPELIRCPLSIAVLKTKKLDMGEPISLLALALDPPNLADIARTILSLKQLGFMSINVGKKVSGLDGELTHMGHIASQLPLDPYLSKLIVLGQAMGCLRETIIIAACLSLKSFHSKPFQDELNAHLSKMSWANYSFSDCIAMLNTYDLWRNLHDRQMFKEAGAANRGGIREEIAGGVRSKTAPTAQ